MKQLLLFISMVIASFLSNAQKVNPAISRGNDYYKLSQFDLAEAEYRKALEADPNNLTAQYNLANALHKQKKYDAAIDILNKVSSVRENNLSSPAYYNEGVNFTKQKSLEASIAAYKNALRINPDDKQARENLQKALSELKRKQEQQQKQQQKPQSNMSQKEAEQKLKLLQEKEKQLQQKIQNQSKQSGKAQQQDW